MAGVYISSENLKKAEEIALKDNLHILDAVNMFTGGSGEIELLSDIRKVKELVKPRPENSHKGSFGKLVLIVGSERYPGAAQISTLAALKSGVGIATVVTTQRAADAVAVSAKEATLLPISSGERGFAAPTERELEDLGEILAGASALLVGPGLGVSDGTLKLLKFAIKNSACPIILDADGINLVSSRIEFLRKAKADLILTPHPGELARLCGISAEQAAAERFSAAKELAERLECTVVAKSAGTLIFSQGRCWLNTFGNNSLSRGGSGDLLAGLISSFAAQGYSPVDSAKLGTAILGLSAERASRAMSRTSALASDVIRCLPLVFKKIERLI